MLSYHCDVEGCESWQRIDTDNPAFYTLTNPTQDDDEDQTENHFCSLNCVMVWAAANSTPDQAHELR